MSLLRGNLGEYQGSAETLRALSELVGDSVNFVEDDGDIFIEFSNGEEDAYNWCQTMNRTVFPRQMGLMVAKESDSVVVALKHFFRFPKTFFHLVSYIREGDAFFNQASREWVLNPKISKFGYFEEGHEDEELLEFVRRQIARLDAGSAELCGPGLANWRSKKAKVTE